MTDGIAASWKDLSCDMLQSQLTVSVPDRLCVSLSTPRFERGAALNGGNVNGMCCDAVVRRIKSAVVMMV